MVVYIHRPFSADGRHSSTSTKSTDFPPDKPGFHHQCSKVNHFPNLTDSSGLEGGLNVPTFKFTRREIPPYKGRGQTCAEVAGNKTAVGSTD